ncbi:PD-(D/E)XK nuclease family protein [Limnofasciculus baicalensis]|uniref:PD-(D/E)XK nuclease family protein n=1 Tax=Limnofasciculus baicalensis BBK-W-15 TaxID=2699891 RepID=A0AAE3KPM1_9CYAN|nr:PD-(D/E)XK nuclease family protein [Limnofasciculus baicalensis]MCP2731685.1 PD-(D/E)XK nuclease family protein [Limnofasciculus baicalensis BBK-W-15]
MVQTVGIAKAVTNLNEAHSKFNLIPTSDAQFFTEWFEDLPDISDLEKESLNRLKNRYLYYAADGEITEGTIDRIMVSPLLDLIGLFDLPFKIRCEKFVKVEIDNGDTVLEGFIDALVVQNKFWVVVIEEKRFNVNVLQAIPQTLAYMMANPNSEMPVFGMVTNGDDYLFIKLNQSVSQYAISDKFTAISRDENNNLFRVLRVIKRIARLVV